MSYKIQINSPPAEEKGKLKLLWYDITDYSKRTQFLICSAAVFVFFVLYGYMQELIFTVDGFHPYGWFLTLVQFAFYTVFGLAENYSAGMPERKISLKIYMLFAALTLGTIGFSNASLGFLNYPMQVIFKCCKLIPVMAGSILIQGKKYGPLDFVAAGLMCIGLTLFTLADSEVSPDFNYKGILMISMALLCDAMIGNVQEKNMKQSGASNAEVMLYSYLIGFFYLLAVMICNGSVLNGLSFYARDPYKLYGYTFIFSLTGYLGIHIILTLVRTCGAFVAVTVTTCRKAVTIIISFVFFSKPFVFQYLTSGMLVVFGIYLNMYSKNNPNAIKDLMAKVRNFTRTRDRKGRAWNV